MNTQLLPCMSIKWNSFIQGIWVFVHFLKIRYAFTFASSINKNLFQTNWEGGCVFCYYAVVRLRNSSSSSSVSVSWFFWASSSTVLRCSVHCRNARKLELRKALTCVRHSSFLFYSLQFNHDQRTNVRMWLKYINREVQYYSKGPGHFTMDWT